jgi:hypothetical protein
MTSPPTANANKRKMPDARMYVLYIWVRSTVNRQEDSHHRSSKRSFQDLAIIVKCTFCGGRGWLASRYYSPGTRTNLRDFMLGMEMSVCFSFPEWKTFPALIGGE